MNPYFRREITHQHNIRQTVFIFSSSSRIVGWKISGERTMQVAKKETGFSVASPKTKTATVLFMSAGDVQRAFTITSGPDGIDVFDVDNNVYACKEMFAGSAIRRTFAETFLADLSWREFSAFISAQKEYLKNIPDINGAFSTPSQGNAARQVESGIRSLVFSDIRTVSLVADDKDESLEYRYPPVDRAGAVAEILAHNTVMLAGTGTSAIGWDVRMSHRWDRSGTPVDRFGEEIDREHDKAWSEASKEGGDIFIGCCDAALKPHLEDEDLSVYGSNGGFVYLAELAGEDMTFSSLSEFKSKLESLPSEDLVQVWSKIRTLDVDFSVPKRTEAVREMMNAARAEFEQEIGDPEEVREFEM